MMKLRLAEMRAQREGALTLYTAPVADRRNESRYEVTIHGARKLVDAVFGKAGVEIDIDPDATEQDATKRAQKLLAAYYERLDVAMREPWRMAAQRARAPKVASPKASRTITVSLSRTSGKGTFWLIATPIPVAWPAGTIVQFVLPRCFNGGAMAVPVSGNPNVAIRFNSPFAPIAAAAAAPAPATDVAMFANAPWFHVYPFNQFIAAGPGPATAILSCWGFSLLPF
jgi:hypothetical protein